MIELINQDELYLECEGLRLHQNLNDLLDHLGRFIERLGFYQYLYTALPTSCCFPVDKPYVFATSYDPTWMQYYIDKAYYQSDSALKYCMSGAYEPYVWQRSFIACELPLSEQRVFKEANEVGIHHGFSLPMRNSIGALGILSCSFDGKDAEFDIFYARRRRMIETFAYAFNEEIIDKFALHFGERHLPKMTTKEIEVLKWLCYGCSYEQISKQLTIGVSTVRKHVSSIITKFQAHNSTHACVLALRWGIVR